MKASELRKKSKEELVKELNELVRERFNLRIQKGTGPKAHLFKKVKIGIARIKTILKEKSV